MKPHHLMDISLVLVGAALVLVTAFGVTERRADAVGRPDRIHVVIDAGHGGEDGGAEAADGTLEKHINLAIAQPLGDLLQVMGYTVSHTRTADTMVNATGDTLRERKVSDLRNRLEQIEQADIAVSIHQNKFPQTQYSGAQMFYAVGNADSKVLAASVRDAVLSLLQPENKRELKKGEDSVYLLSHATRPLVLVECGFLSNEAERERLKTRVYQREMAFAVACGIFEF